MFAHFIVYIHILWNVQLYFPIFYWVFIFLSVCQCSSYIYDIHLFSSYLLFDIYLFICILKNTMTVFYAIKSIFSSFVLFFNIYGRCNIRHYCKNSSHYLIWSNPQVVWVEYYYYHPHFTVKKLTPQVAVGNWIHVISLRAGSLDHWSNSFFLDFGLGVMFRNASTSQDYVNSHLYFLSV